jgi:CheY-like chemotaxis protein
MAKYRILVVDDQLVVRQLLQSSLESLGDDYVVLTVPSAEEAQLEFSLGSFDLLVSDIRLPGKSGLELFRVMRQRNPALKVILITGLEEPGIRRQVADAGAHAFFFKPIEVSDFLDAVERLLGVVESTTPEDYLLEIEDPQEQTNATDRIVRLRHDLNAITTVLLNNKGNVMARAGDLPDAAYESSLIPAVMATFSTSEKVARFLGMESPRDLLYFSGMKYDLFLAHIDSDHALLTMINPLDIANRMEQTVTMVQEAVIDIQNILARLGLSKPALSTILEESKIIPPDKEETIPLADREKEPEPDPELDAIFAEQEKELDATAESFWDEFEQEDAGKNIRNADDLTYEQARQLGLIPDEED